MPTKVYVTHLYPKEMSIYGDIGNILALKFRLNSLDIQIIYQPVNLGESLPPQTDFYFIGGGQDKEQYTIFKDLLIKKQKLLDDIENNVCLLSICGGYQLLGKSFVTGEGQNIEGIGLFEIETKAQDNSVKTRCIGNLVIESFIPDLKKAILVGFENHGGQTYFITSSPKAKAQNPLGKVISGYGNNSFEKMEGCVYKNAIGTYLHGSCLPKNPELTDFFIHKILQNKLKSGSLDRNTFNQLIKQKIDDSIALEAKKAIIERFAKA